MTLPAPLPAQRNAADPHKSFFVMANAGSGKTTVLVDRIVRLMLQGSEPSTIQCLTYTKAAAVEMIERLRQRLRVLVMFDDDLLIKELARLTGSPPTDDMIIRARQLFSNVLEQPGPYIETIHGFAQRLLALFPEEAGLPAGSRLANENELRDINMRADQQLFQHIKNMKGGEEACAYFEARHGASTLFTLIRHLQPKNAAEMPTAASVDEMQRINFDQQLQDFLQAIKDHKGKKTQQFFQVGQDYCCNKYPLSHLTRLFLTKAGQPLKSLAKDIDNDFFALQNLFMSLLSQEVLAQLGKEHADLKRLGALRQLLWEKEKEKQSVIDFDDLIHYAQHLLAQASDKDFVRWVLDGKIDHLMLDEAQDTSLPAWNIISILMEDIFHAPEGKTVFVVGDVKQSIYGFQGASPESFIDVRNHFIDRKIYPYSSAQNQALPVSFRSSKPILEFVDALFQDPATAEKIAGPGGEVHHELFMGDAPGRVDLWPLPSLQQPPESDPWSDPVNRYARISPAVILCQELAEWLSGQLSVEHPECGGPQLRPKDVFILFRKRGALLREMTRALHAKNIPCSGADRLLLSDEILCRDVVSLLRWLAYEFDDMNLAAVLRSSFMGLSEDQLMMLSLDRIDEGRSLWEQCQLMLPDISQRLQNLRICVQSDGILSALERFFLHDLHAVVAHVRYGPSSYVLLELILDKLHEMVFDGIVDPMTLAAELRNDQTDIKREVSHQDDLVQLTTVHGAKGREARLVIILDATADISKKKSPHTTEVEGGKFLYTHVAEGTPLPDVLNESMSSRKQHKADEDLRLFYVAATRAKSHLIVAGPGRKKSKLAEVSVPEGSWYHRAEAALGQLGACYASDGRFVYEYKGDSKEEKKQLKPSQSGIPYPNKDIPIVSATTMRPLMDMSEKSSQAAQRGVSYHHRAQNIIKLGLSVDDQDPILNWFAKLCQQQGWYNHEVFIEHPLATGDGHLYFADIVMRDEKENWIVVELKTGAPRVEHQEQVERYCACLGKQTCGVLVYLDRQEMIRVL